MTKFVISFLAFFLLTNIAAQDASINFTPKQVIEQAFSMSSPTLTALDVAIYEGFLPCRIPTPYDRLALGKPTSYADQIVSRVFYDACGIIVIQLNTGRKLGTLSGKVITLWPELVATNYEDGSNGHDVIWRIDPKSTVTEKYLLLNQFGFKVHQLPNKR